MIFCSVRSAPITLGNRTKPWTGLRACWLPKRDFLAFCLLVTLSALPAPVAANDWSLFSTQDRLNYDETRSLLIGNTLNFPGLGQSTYHSSGVYTFTYENENITEFGYFEVRRDGRVCLDLQDQNSGCSTFIKRNGLVFMLTPEGRRFQVRLGLEAN